MPNNNETLEMDPEMRMRVGRTLRRISRTTKDLMNKLGIQEDEVRIPRKKRKPRVQSPSKD